MKGAPSNIDDSAARSALVPFLPTVRSGQSERSRFGDTFSSMQTRKRKRDHAAAPERISKQINVTNMFCSFTWREIRKLFGVEPKRFEYPKGTGSAKVTICHAEDAQRIAELWNDTKLFERFVSRRRWSNGRSVGRTKTLEVSMETKPAHDQE